MEAVVAVADMVEVDSVVVVVEAAVEEVSPLLMLLLLEGVGVGRCVVALEPNFRGRSKGCTTMLFEHFIQVDMAFKTRGGDRLL